MDRDMVRTTNFKNKMVHHRGVDECAVPQAILGDSNVYKVFKALKSNQSCFCCFWICDSYLFSSTQVQTKLTSSLALCTT